MTKRSRNCLRDVMEADQEREYYNQVLDRIIDNPRKYLDDLEFMDVFRVSFLNYSEKRRKKPKPL